MEKIKKIYSFCKIFLKIKKTRVYLFQFFLMNLIIHAQYFLTSSFFIDVLLNKYEKQQYKLMFVYTGMWLVFSAAFIAGRYFFDIEFNGNKYNSLLLDCRESLLKKYWGSACVEYSQDENFNFLDYYMELAIGINFKISQMLALFLVITYITVWGCFKSASITFFILLCTALFYVINILNAKKKNKVNTDIFNQASIIRNKIHFLFKGEESYIVQQKYNGIVEEILNKNKRYYSTQNKLFVLESVKESFKQFLYILTYLIIIILGVLLYPEKSAHIVLVMLTLYMNLNSYAASFIDLTGKCLENFYLIDQYLERNNLCDISFPKTSNSDVALETKNLSLYTKDKIILSDINITVSKNKKVAIIGQNGSGKSSLIKIITKEIKASSGQVYVNEKSISYIPSKTSLFPVSIEENILYGTKDKTYDADKVSFIDSIEHDRNLILENNEDSLSGGEAQRVSIATALVSDNNLLIADEPTSALNSELEKVVFEKIISKPCALLYVAHNPELVEKADYVYLLKDGKVCQKGLFCEVKKTSEYQEWLNDI